MSQVIVNRSGHVATVTLNRPEAMNALSRTMRIQFWNALQELADDDSVRAIVLTGAGRAFCAGLDLKELGTAGVGVIDASSDDPSLNPIKAIEYCPQPVIGAINGAAITGGFELALACDILLASDHARFADTHSRVGVMPGWGLSQKLSRAIGLGRAKQLSLSGNFLGAEDALAWGLVNQVFKPAELLSAAVDLGKDIASADQPTVRRYRQLIDDGYMLPLGEGLNLESEWAARANRNVKAMDIARQRTEVTERGRMQS